MNLELMKCPGCGKENNAFSASGAEGRTPEVGDPSVCLDCGYIAIFEEDHMRPCTKVELEALRERDDVRRLQALIALQKLNGLLTGTMANVHAVGVEFGITRDGRVDMVSSSEELPDQVRQLFVERMQEIELDRRTDDVAEHVTPEVANHVLAVHGDEQASWPPMAVSALIHLIKVCRESNDEMLHHIDHCKIFHGYVLAMDMIDRPSNPPEFDGRAMLRVLAELDPMPDDDDDNDNDNQPVQETVHG